MKCTHKGCGKDFDPENNKEGDCQYHPGGPIFHEGLKGWQCCSKRVVEFDEFLKIPGCTTGKHTDEKPVEEAKPAAQEPLPAAKARRGSVEVYENGAQVQYTADTPPPQTLGDIVAKLDDEIKPAMVQPIAEEVDDPSIPVLAGTTCKHRGCGKQYVDDATSRQEGSPEAVCVYHPGAPIFHEGSKGWSCCSRRVLEFDEFLKIKGCKTGKHLFASKKKENEQEELVDCRKDWYQTQTQVILSIFAKNKEDVKVEFFPQKIEIDIKMKNHQRYRKTIPLFERIDPTQSSYESLTTKLEVTLVKANGLSWAALEPTENAKTWTTFGVPSGSTGGTVGGKQMYLATDSPYNAAYKQ
ncbi:hypothetical protein BZG36_03466 [Bifiguratus adelaidae]|uniref:Chord-domain-containing protein n=1 Tax=Bifiguratus adelaidae TaxID=1938954 RepID=A0A261XZM8_9FUNG|nr:hypothetical protein BZG36_03466 [Bifiguratus adelaidae]